MTQRTCSEGGCERPVEAYRLCRRHYQRITRQLRMNPGAYAAWKAESAAKVRAERAAEKAAQLATVTAKSCTKCREVKSLTDFYAHKRGMHGCMPECKECWKATCSKRRAEIKKHPEKAAARKAYEAAYSKANRDKRNAANRRWQKNNPEKMREYARLYRERHPEKVREMIRNWRMNNPEKAAKWNGQWAKANPEKNRARVREWVKANPEKARAGRRRWKKNNPEKVREERRQRRLNNPEKFREKLRQWKKDNPDKVRELEARRRARLRNATVGTVDYVAILERHGWGCHICQGSIAGWKQLHMDHVIPIARGGEHSMENIRPAHRSCNMRKWAKLVDELDFLAQQ